MRIDRKLAKKLDEAVREAMNSSVIIKATEAICEAADCSVFVDISIAFEPNKKKTKPVRKKMDDAAFLKSIGIKEE